MCTETSYTLRCEHVVTKMLYCSDAPPLNPHSRRTTRKPCKKCIRNSVPWPPPPDCEQQIVCPLPHCPFEERGGYWNCCWCGKEWNEKGWSAMHKDSIPWRERRGERERGERKQAFTDYDSCLGRCSCVMIIDRQEYRCDHICCETCEAATEFR